MFPDTASKRLETFTKRHILLQKIWILKNNDVTTSNLESVSIFVFTRACIYTLYIKFNVGRVA